jgi:DNA ligase 1
MKVLAGAISVKTSTAAPSAVTTTSASPYPKAVAAPTVVSSASASGSATAPRMFEFTVGTSSKFLEVTLAGIEVIARFGKIGTAGQSKPKPFPTTAAAKK